MDLKISEAVPINHSSYLKSEPEFDIKDENEEDDDDGVEM
jgi:hypothetical protein